MGTTSVNPFHSGQLHSKRTRAISALLLVSTMEYCYSHAEADQGPHLLYDNAMDLHQDDDLIPHIIDDLEPFLWGLHIQFGCTTTSNAAKSQTLLKTGQLPSIEATEFLDASDDETSIEGDLDGQLDNFFKSCGHLSHSVSSDDHSRIQDHRHQVLPVTHESRY
jgi:hypothetical protein